MLTWLGRLLLRRIRPKALLTELRCISDSLAKARERHTETSIRSIRLSTLSRSVGLYLQYAMQTFEPLLDVSLIQPLPYYGNHVRPSKRVQIFESLFLQTFRGCCYLRLLVDHRS